MYGQNINTRILPFSIILNGNRVALGVLSRNEMVFDKVGKDAVYLPVVWKIPVLKRFMTHSFLT